MTRPRHILPHPLRAPHAIRIVTLCFALAAILPSVRGDEPAPVDYLRDVKPIFVERCVACHGPDKQQSDLRLDTAAAATSGGISGPAIVSGNSGESLVIQAVTGVGDVARMPPEDAGQPLTAEQISALRLWIDAGATAPADELPLPAVQPKGAYHWSFQPLANPTPPSVQREAWIRNDIDRFVLAPLEARGLAPSPPADRAALLRRVSFDLTGLPPVPELVLAFELDNRPDAYERMVDELLKSPHYGERWGRHWLDQARYADSNGYTIDSGRSIWKYRDWVIHALNRDLPFDQFALWQLAGDMLPKATLDQKIATGFHRNTMVNEEGGTDQEQFRIEAVADRLATTGAVFLGLTVGCARCHDHKYDPISQREYYQLFAIFNGADEPSLQVPTDQQARELPGLLADIEQMETRLATVDANLGTRQIEWEAKMLAAGEELAKLPDELRAVLMQPTDQRTPEQRDKLLAEYKKIDPERAPLAKSLDELKQRHKQLISAITTTLVLHERDQPRQTHVHLRGDFLRPGAAVQPGAPAVLPELFPSGDRVTRLDFARWLFDPRQPLTARVTVNRVWQHYFGQGLVVTENDFGTQGDRPSHPELLDWLAGRFAAGGWSLKALHRLIVTSAAYQQSSDARADLAAADPYNKLMARQVRLRLEAEAVRDAALAVSGLLSREVGGPSVYPPQPQGIYRFTQQVKYWKESQGVDRFRRGLYTYFWRSSPHPFLVAFDAPDATTACTRRVRSNSPLQALTLANDPMFFELAQGLAGRVLREVAARSALESSRAAPETTDEARLDHAWRLSVARPASGGERQRLREFLDVQRSHFAAHPEAALALSPAATQDAAAQVEHAAWTAVARVLLNLDEFIVRP